MKVTSVRARLLMWNIGILTAILFAFLLATHFAVRGYLLTSIDRRLEGMSRGMNRVLDHIDERRPPMPQSQPPPPPRQTDDRERNASDRERAGADRLQRRMRFFDLQGKAITLFGQTDLTMAAPLDATALKQAMADAGRVDQLLRTHRELDRDALAKALAGAILYSFARDEEGSLRVLTKPLVRDNKQIGVMQLASSFAEAKVMLNSLTLMLLLLMPCALVLAGVGGYFLTRHTLGPIRQIIDAAESLNPDDLSQRLPVVGADEFAHLANTMNGMLGRIEGAFTRLMESIERERRFTADASHELRTPLTAIKANTSLALKGERAPEQYREALRAVNQAADSMTRLVQDLLLLARSDSGQLTLDSRQVNPRELFQEAVAAMRQKRGHAPVRVDIADDAQQIGGDRQHLQRLVNNLLENALRHTPADGLITLEARRRDDMIVLTVADNGEGISPEHLAHLGERFFRADPSRARQHGGTGLGLAICRSIVDAHGGTMTIDSAPGEGTRVTVELPGAG